MPVVHSSCSVEIVRKRPAKKKATSPEDVRREQEAAEQRRQLTKGTRSDATRFAEADVDGNQQLDFEEFLAMQPQRIRDTCPVSDIKKWFSAADTDHSGTLSINESFRWTLSNNAEKHGTTALQAAFEKYDKDGTGFLDSTEFAAVANDMGFGVVAHELFSALDHDKSGAVTYSELIDSLKQDTPADPETKKMISTLVWTWDQAAQEDTKRTLNTKGWKIRGDDVKTIRLHLRERLRESGAHVADLVQLFDEDADGGCLLIDDVEFITTMRKKFGYQGSNAVLDDVFRSLDTDHSGKIGFDELFEFVRGYRHSLDERNKKVRALKLEVPEGASYTFDEVAWDVETLRILMQQMLSRSCAGPSDLMKVWDQSGDNQLSRKEFVEHMHGFFKEQDEVLWHEEVARTVDEAFAAIQGKFDRDQSYIDIIELERWLDRPSDRPKESLIKLKTVKELRKQASIRQMANNPVPDKRVNVQVQADMAINKAAAAFALKSSVAQHDELRVMRRWRNTHRPQAGGQRFELPPLQRWELPRVVESSITPFKIGVVGSPPRSPTSSSPRDIQMATSPQPRKPAYASETRFPRSMFVDDVSRSPLRSPRLSPRLAPIRSRASPTTDGTAHTSHKAQRRTGSWTPRVPRHSLMPLIVFDRRPKSG